MYKAMHFINFGFNFVVMVRSVIPAIRKLILATAIILSVSLSYCFKIRPDDPDWLAWTNKCLAQSYDDSGDEKLKKIELSVTADFFIRMRKTYAKGNQVYYSFNLHQFNDMDYLGTTTNGTLQLKTVADDIIFQTYNDRHGDIDTMTTVLNIPVKNMEPERLDSLREALNYFKTKGQ